MFINKSEGRMTMTNKTERCWMLNTPCGSWIYLYILMGITAMCGNSAFATDGLSDWQGIANKNYVFRIMHDSDNLYVSSLGAGVTLIEKSTGKQQTFNRANEKSFDNSILDMIMYDGDLWAAGRYYGLGKLSDSGNTKFDMVKAGCLSTQWMQGLLIDNPDDILVGGLLAFYQFDGNKCTYSYFLNPLSPMGMVTDIKKNKKGEVFVSCYDWWVAANSLFQFVGGELVPIENPCYRINRMAVDGDALWLASDGNGLVKYENGDFTQYDINNSDIPDNIISDVCLDSKGGIWMTSFHHITVLKDGEFISYTLPEEWTEEDDCFLSIDVDENIVYAGTKKHGLVKLVDDSISIVTLIDNPDFCNSSLGDIRGSSSMDKDGNFLMASAEGLNVYDPLNGDSRIIPYSDLREVCVSPINGDVWILRTPIDGYACVERIGDEPLSFTSESLPFYIDVDFFNKMSFDRAGNLWVAVSDGLMCYDGETWKSFSEKDAGFPIGNIKCMASDSKNRLWCGAFGKNRIGNGLIMYDGTNWYNYKTKNSGIPSDFVGSINIDHDDVVWLNCRDELNPETDEKGFGLTSYDGHKWTTYNMSNSSICSNNIYSIAVDTDNRKWLATTGDKGVMSFDGKDWTLYSVDNSGLGINTAINITTDPKHDLIWFVQYSNNGVSYAKLNTSKGGINPITDASEESTLGFPLTVYDMQGSKEYSTQKYEGERIPVGAGIYIVVTPMSSRKIIIR